MTSDPQPGFPDRTKPIPSPEGTEEPTDNAETLSVTAGKLVVIYDGECGFCRAMVNFAHQRLAGRVQFLPSNTASVTAFLATNQLTDTARETVIALSGSHVSLRSDAVLETMKRMKFPWEWTACFGRMIPKRIRDAIYNQVARRRHCNGTSCRIEQ